MGGAWGYVDSSGFLAIPPKFQTKDFKAALAFVEGIGRAPADQKFGYINREGEFIIPPGFDIAGPFSHGLACVELDGHCGFIDKSGQFKIASRFESADDFREGLARVRVGGQNGFIDVEGDGYFAEVHRGREF